VFTQAEPFQQADGSKRQQIDQRQVARLDEGRTEGGEQLLGVHRSSEARHGARGNDHEHGVRAQQESHDDDRYAKQRP
jgi:hypothetical protein